MPCCMKSPATTILSKLKSRADRNEKNGLLGVSMGISRKVKKSHLSDLGCAEEVPAGITARARQTPPTLGIVERSFDRSADFWGPVGADDPRRWSRCIASDGDAGFGRTANRRCGHRTDTPDRCSPVSTRAPA